MDRGEKLSNLCLPSLRVHLHTVLKDQPRPCASLPGSCNHSNAALLGPIVLVEGLHSYNNDLWLGRFLLQGSLECSFFSLVIPWQSL